ncbi:MAG: hypothetical protein FWF38_03765 [Spirochaetaceae bacterium]|nr:hypothetical protein [Spirochaetaceae bacterium]
MEILDEEYEELKKDAEAYNSGREIWCWTKFKKEWISRVFLAWVAIMALSAFVIFMDIKIETNVLFLLGGATLIFMLEKPLGKLLGENTKISAEAKVGAQANINTDTAKVLEAVKGKEK